MQESGIVILGIFVADAAYRADRQPRIGETILGKGFALGPGGKGSNQAVAAARLGSQVKFITRIGDDAFARMARDMWARDNIESLVVADPGSFTGSAYIFVDDATGNNAIIVVPGAASDVGVQDIEQNADSIRDASIFMAQFETPIDAAKRGMEIAKSSGTTTVLNPAPAAAVDRDLLELCDYLVPNESEAETLTGMRVQTVEDAREASRALREMGAKSVIVTLGENGALLNLGGECKHLAAFNAGPVVETTGAGDSFCGGFAHALLQGHTPYEATRYACAAASISVTRPGTAPSMPSADEVELLLSKL
ncbi:MAG: ribokinase [Albidovulum sp.]|nr:ribokinase [Albidovulum sp.]